MIDKPQSDEGRAAARRAEIRERASLASFGRMAPAGGHDTTEMQQRSIRQWESVGERKVALDKAIRIYVRTIRQELR
jgi:hypothetical protein